MQTQKVFVIWTNPLFHASVVLLLENPNIELVGATSDYAEAVDEISKHQPDTILIEKTGMKVPAEVLEILDSSSWKMRIFDLNLNDNELSIYHREHKPVVQVEDLLSLIISDTSSSNKNLSK